MPLYYLRDYTDTGTVQRRAGIIRHAAKTIMNLNCLCGVLACNFYRRDHPTVGASGDERTICIVGEATPSRPPSTPGVYGAKRRVGRPCPRFCHSDLAGAAHISAVTRRDDAGLWRPHTAGDLTRACQREGLDHVIGITDDARPTRTKGAAP